ncbi:MAG: methyltransferase domain-containing protein [Nitriliruptorales bacterium]|nr:methyltransferase domain-containing protein [Nitriliruptorales bacterium]
MEIDERTVAYLRRFAEPEDEPLRAARARSEEADIPAVAGDTGAMLRFFASLMRARHICEVGTGGGYSGLWFLGGMDARGSLTTIEIDGEHQSLAQRAFGEARSGDRVRSMLGPALTVLPKLADGNYDIVFLDAVKAEYVEYLQHAKRLLRPGGLLLADNVLWHGRIVDNDVSDEDTDGIRDFNESVREDRTFRGTILTVGDGLFAAVYDPNG